MNAGEGNLEKTLKEADQWLYYRFDENYTARFADALKREVAEALSPELGDKDRENIVNGYEKSEMYKAFKNYFTTLYSISEIFSNLSQEDAGVLNEDGQSVVERASNAALGTAKFIDDLCQNPKLDQRAIEKGFINVYRSPADFISAYLAMIELIMHERATIKTAQTIEREFEGSGGEAKRFIQEIHGHAKLLINETLRAHQEFMPRVAQQALGDLYREKLI